MAFTFVIVYDEFSQITQHYFSVTNEILAKWIYTMQ